MKQLIILENDTTNNIIDNVNSILKSIGFIEQNNIFKKTIKNRFVVKIVLIKQVNESTFMNVVNSIITETTNTVDVKIEIVDKKTNKKELINTQFSANKDDIIKQIKQMITDKFLNKNNTDVSKLIKTGIAKLNDDELSAFKFFYGEKFKNILTQLGM